MKMLTAANLGSNFTGSYKKMSVWLHLNWDEKYSVPMVAKFEALIFRKIIRMHQRGDCIRQSMIIVIFLRLLSIYLLTRSMLYVSNYA